MKPSKIVAGHEPEQTNRLLQRIAIIITKKIDTSPVANGESTKTESKKNESPTKPKARRSSDPKVKVSRTASKDTPEPKKAKSRTLSKEDSQKISPGKKPKKIEKQKTIKDIEVASINTLESAIAAQQEPSSEQEETRKRSAEFIKQETSSELETKENRRNSGDSLVVQGTQDKRKKSGDRKSSSGGSRKSSAEKKSTSEDRKPSARKPLEDRKNSIPEEPLQILKNEVAEVEKFEKSKDIVKRTSSVEDKVNNEYEGPIRVGSQSKEPARKSEDVEAVKVPPPLTRQNSILSRPRTSLRPPSARPPSARPGAPRRRDKSIEIVLQPNEITKVGGVNVKVDTFNSELEDDGENLIVIENSNIEEDVLGNKQIDQMIIEDEDHQKGHLVQQILETQKELVQEDKGDIEKALKERKNRQTSATQIDSLRGLIQTLTKAVNPTGKLLDFIPEDIDSMQLELTMWRDTYAQAAAELKREKR